MYIDVCMRYQIMKKCHNKSLRKIKNTAQLNADKNSLLSEFIMNIKDKKFVEDSVNLL